MNKRTREVLRGLALEGPASVEQLAKRFRVSERTIRNDIVEINFFLRKNGFEEIQVLKGGLLQPGRDIAETLNLNIEQDAYTYRLSKEERIDITAMALMTTEPAVTIGELSQLLQVSRATVAHELDEVREMLQRHGLKVRTYSNKGLCVDGAESVRRKALFQLVWKLADDTRVDDIQFPHYPGMDLNEVVEPARRAAICRIINEQEHACETFFTDQSFAKLQCYILVVMIRLESGMLLEAQEKRSELRYPFAKTLMSYISQYCGFAMSEDEVRMLSCFLETLRYTKKKSDPEIIRIQMVTRRFIAAISETLHVSLTNDLEFYQDLSNHLSSILKEHPFLDENPLITQIAEDYPNILRVVQLHKHILEECCGRSLNKIEQEYIVVHICVAVERITNYQRELSVILVCGAGIATSRLLYEKLSRQFNVVAMFSAHDVEGIRKCNADLIVSTVPLQFTRVETVVVSAVLTREDSLRIFAKADEIRKRWNELLRPKIEDIRNPRQLLRTLQTIVEEETGRTEGALYDRITEAIMHYFDLNELPEEGLLLQQILSPELLQLDVQCVDWQEAVRLAAQPLLDRGYIETAYLDSVFNLIEQNGPYMVMAPGLIVPHANYCDGVNKLGMSLIRLSQPVDFGEEDYQKNIRFVCCLSPVDSFGHLQALMNLTNLFGNADFHAEAEMAESSDALYDLICRREREMEPPYGRLP